MIDPIKPLAPEPDALAITRKLVQKIDGNPRLQRAIQKAVKQLRAQPGDAAARKPFGQ